MVHGTQHKIAIPSAMAGRASRARVSLWSRYAAQTNRNGSTLPSAGFVSRAKPQRTPYAHQSRTRRDSASAGIAHRIVAASRAVSDVSQIHWNGITIAFGKNAHNHAARLATALPAIRFPAKYIDTHVAAEKSMFSAAAA